MPSPEDLCARHERELADLQKELAVVSGEMWRVAERIPEDLAARLTTMEVVLKGLADDVHKNFVSREEFALLKSEHINVRNLVYGFVGVILLAVISALVALVLKK